DRQRPAEMNEDQGRGVRTKAVRRGVTERVEARVADHEIETHGEEPEDQRFGYEREGEWLEDRCGRADQRGERGKDDADAHLTLACRACRRDARSERRA